jgi:hypothetical protein
VTRLGYFCRQRTTLCAVSSFVAGGRRRCPAEKTVRRNMATTAYTPSMRLKMTSLTIYDEVSLTLPSSGYDAIGANTVLCCAECGKEEGGTGALVSRRASRVCRSSIATPHVRGSIGRRIKLHVNYGPPNYAMRCCSRTHHPRRNVPFASYRCR